MPLKQRVPKLKGFNNPFRVEYQAGQPRQLAGSRRSTTVDPERARTPRASCARATSSRCSAAARSPARSTSRPTAFRRPPRRPSRPQAVASRLAAAVQAGSPAGQGQPVHQPLTPACTTAGRRQLVDMRSRVLSNLKNVFKVPDLRNKILFTLVMIALYRLGVAIPVPGHRPRGRQAAARTGRSSGARSASSTCSPAARSRSFSIFALGIMPYITARIIMQVLGVVIPKLEQWQQAGRGRPAQDHPVDPLPGHRHRRCCRPPA